MRLGRRNVVADAASRVEHVREHATPSTVTLKLSVPFPSPMPSQLSMSASRNPIRTDE